MIRRDLEDALHRAARQMPVVTVTGPRQSGKTTLCRAAFPDRPYVSLEARDTRNYALDDPRGFLDEYREGAVFDEVQRVPDLRSYLQEVVDENPEPGKFILTGSQHFGLSESISQSSRWRKSASTSRTPRSTNLRSIGSASRRSASRSSPPIPGTPWAPPSSASGSCGATGTASA